MILSGTWRTRDMHAIYCTGATWALPGEGPERLRKRRPHPQVFPELLFERAGVILGILGDPRFGADVELILKASALEKAGAAVSISS